MLEVTESNNASNWSFVEEIFWNLHESARALIDCKNMKQYLHY
jgi:hypothetical protein